MRTGPGLLGVPLLAAALLSVRLRQARSTVREKEVELAAARDSAKRLEEEAEALRASAEGRTAEILADNADLRRRMDQLADAILARHGGPPA